MNEHCMLDYVIFWRILSHMYGWLDWNKWNEIPVRYIPVHAVVSFFILVLYMHYGWFL
jgi:hypothetical protein